MNFVWVTENDISEWPVIECEIALNVDAIVSIERVGKYLQERGVNAVVRTVRDKAYNVKESPEEIIKKIRGSGCIGLVTTETIEFKDGEVVCK